MVLKLKAATKEYIWAGSKLKSKWGFSAESGADKIAEAWSLSFHKDGLSTVSEPQNLAGKSISEVCPREGWGSRAQSFNEFPVLIKFIDSGDNLSVQVHPSDEFAQKNEGQFGKTEMWYVVDCDEGAGLYVGFKKSITKEEYAKRIEDSTLLEVLNFIKVKKGESYFIPSGTVHAIGAGCTIVEVQQNSNVTYRVFDYNRVGADGLARPLHVEKAKAVSSLQEYKPQVFGGKIIAACKYFTTEKFEGKFSIDNSESFTAITVIKGSGNIGGIGARAGETFYVSAGEKTVADMSADGVCLVTTV